MIPRTTRNRTCARDGCSNTYDPFDRDEPIPARFCSQECARGKRPTIQTRRKPVRRPLPNHFKRNGKPKKPLTRDEAAEQASLHRKNAYRCDFCGHWHIGGVPRRRVVAVVERRIVLQAQPPYTEPMDDPE